MGWTFAQRVGGTASILSGGTDTLALTPDANTTSGSILIAIYAGQHATPSISDSDGNTWTLIRDRNNGDGKRVTIWAVKQGGQLTTSEQITLSFDPLVFAAGAALLVAEFTNTAGFFTQGDENDGVGTSLAVSSGTIPSPAITTLLIGTVAVDTDDTDDFAPDNAIYWNEITHVTSGSGSNPVTLYAFGSASRPPGVDLNEFSGDMETGWSGDWTAVLVSLIESSGSTLNAGAAVLKAATRPATITGGAVTLNAGPAVLKAVTPTVKLNRQQVAGPAVLKAATVTPLISTTHYPASLVLKLTTTAAAISGGGGVQLAAAPANMLLATGVAVLQTPVLTLTAPSARLVAALLGAPTIKNYQDGTGGSGGGGGTDGEDGHVIHYATGQADAVFNNSLAGAAMTVNAEGNSHGQTGVGTSLGLPELETGTYDCLVDIVRAGFERIGCPPPWTVTQPGTLGGVMPVLPPPPVGENLDLALWLRAHERVFAHADYSAQFVAGNSEYLSIADNASLSVGAGVSLTLAAWVWLDTKASTQSVICKRGSAGTQETLEYWLSFNSSSGRFAFQVGDGTATPGSVTSTSGFAEGTWVFLLAWYDAAEQTLNIQMNDGTVNRATWVSPGILDGTAGLALGRNGEVSFFYLSGRLDAVAVWKRVLAADERSFLYGQGRGRTYSETTSRHRDGMSAWWELDEASGSRADAHGANHLTDNNTVTQARGVHRTTTLADGTAVVEWAEPDGLAVIQFTAASQPSYETEEIAGLPALAFDGTADHLARATPAGADPLKPSQFTMLALVRFAAAGGVQPALAHSSGYALQGNGNPIKPECAISTVSGSITAVSQKSILAADWVLLEARYDGSRLRLWVDGEMTADYPWSGGNLLFSGGEGTFMVAGKAADRFGGRVAEVVLAGAALSRAAQEGLRDYLDTKYLLELPDQPTELDGTGLVAYWKLDETSGTRSDATGRGNHLTDENTVASLAGGKIGNAALFVASNQERLVIPSNEDLQMPSIQSFTLAGWVYIANKTAYHVFADKGSGGGIEYRIQYYQATDRIRFVVGNTALEANAFGSPPEDQWFFVCGWYDASANTLNLQVNDSAVNSMAMGTYPTEVTSTFRLGGSYDLIFLDGGLDEWSVWRRVLSSTERASLYRMGHAQPYPFSGSVPLSVSLTGLTAYWKLDEETGYRLDATGRGNDLQQVGTCTAATGKLGKALTLTNPAGRTDYLTIPDNADLSTGDIDFTVTGWFKLATLPPVGVMYVVASKSTAGSNREWFFGVTNTGEVTFQVFNAAGSAIGTVTTATSFVTTGTWYYFAAWHDAVGNRVGVQIDNRRIQTSATTGVPGDTTSAFSIGVDLDVSTSRWDGQIDSLGFWKRVLSTAERRALWSAGNGLDYPFGQSVIPVWRVGTRNLSGFWNMDEFSGERADATGKHLLFETANIAPANIQASQGRLDLAVLLNSTHAQGLTAMNQADFQVSDNLTLTAWVRFDNLTNIYGIISKWFEMQFGGLDAEYRLIYDVTTERLAFQIRNTADTDTFTVQANALGKPVVGQWYHCVAWHDSVRAEIGLQVNGGPVEITGTGGGGVRSSTNGFDVGITSVNGFPRGLSGSLDAVGIWRRLLNAEEREALYSLGLGLQYPFTTVQLPVISASRLVGYWRLDEASGTRSDLSGYGHHLTDNNTVTQAAGKIGNAANFVAANTEYLSLAGASATALAWSRAESFTVTAWCFYQGNANYQTIISKGDPGSAEWRLMYWQASNRFRINWLPGNQSAEAADFVPVEGGWFFVSAWYDHLANTINIQINNNTVYSTVISGTATTTGAFYIGRDTQSFVYWNGRIDEVAFWRRTLSAAERSALYNAGKGQPFPFHR